ncbi:MAG TPA: copper resistance protein CopC [Acetobacteraceae bacterium]
MMHATLRGAYAALLLSMPGLLAPCLAHAHAHLRQAEPPVGGTVHAAPAQVELTFSEAVEPRFSTVAVTDAAGAQVDHADLHVAGGDARHLAVSVSALRPGTYTVVWHATAVDTHKTEGSFTFTVAP